MYSLYTNPRIKIDFIAVFHSVTTTMKLLYNNIYIYMITE